MPKNLPTKGRVSHLIVYWQLFLAVVSLVACATQTLNPGVETEMAILLPAPDAAERAVMSSGSKGKGQPMQVGIGRSVPVELQNIRVDKLAWQKLGATRAAHFTVQSPHARGLRLGMQVGGATDCGLQFQFFGADGQVGDAVKESIVRNAEDLWWSPVMAGDTAKVTLTLSVDAATDPCVVRVPRISHLY